jgi:hypothetical protein
MPAIYTDTSVFIYENNEITPSGKFRDDKLSPYGELTIGPVTFFICDPVVLRNIEHAARRLADQYYAHLTGDCDD